MHETKKLEFKETITNTFLKTVSAFSNYNGGEIYFGVKIAINIKQIAVAETTINCVRVADAIRSMR